MNRFFFAVLVFAIPNVASAAGGVVRNGGDSVMCLPPGTSVPFLFNLDYIVSLGKGIQPERVSSWEASRLRLLAILKTSAPELAGSFEAYSATVLGENLDSLPTRKWRRLEARPPRMPDEVIPQNGLPAECAGTLILPYRMVTRVWNPAANEVQYEYWRGIAIKDPNSQMQLWQFSFLMVHEWLRDFTDDLDHIREADGFLHSEAARTLPREEVRSRLHELGIL